MKKQKTSLGHFGSIPKINLENTYLQINNNLQSANKYVN